MPNEGGERMKQGKWAAPAFCALLWMLCVAQALALDAAPEELIHEALLGTMSDGEYPNSEFFAEGHAVLETQEKADTLEIYLSAAVGGYGFMGGGFVMQNGWRGPCTVVLQRRGEEWALREVREVESYSQISKIMPSSAADRFFKHESDDSIQEQIEAQARAYLESIGRTEPILSPAEASGELSGLLSCAGSLRSSVDRDYPLGNTTIERLEDGERYLYTRSWIADEDAEADPVYSSYGKETLSVSGTTGAETLTRVRKSDGKLLERIGIRVEYFKVIITLADDYGSVRYEFPFDGWEYHQPQITTSGECRIDTTRLDQLAGELAGYAETDTWG